MLGKEDEISANPDVIFAVYMPYSEDDPDKIRLEKLDVILNDETFASLDSVKQVKTYKSCITSTGKS